MKRMERAPSLRRRRRRATSGGDRLPPPSDVRTPGAAERRRHAAILVLAAVGFVTSVYLVGLHENLAGGEATTSFCTISSEIDCTPVLRSRYASFWGVPIAAYGAWYYTVVAAFAAVGSTSMTRTRAAAAARSIMLLGTTVLGALLSVMLAAFHGSSFETSAGSRPPLVSHRQTTSAPAFSAACHVAIAYSGSSVNPSKLCSASYTTVRP